MSKNKKPPIEEKKKQGVNIAFSLVDTLGFGMNLVKSGLNLKQAIDSTIDKKMDEMVQKGSLSKEEASKAGENLKAEAGKAIDSFSGRMSEGIRKTLNRLNIATLDDLRSLEKQLDSLLNELESIGKSESGKKTKSASKKPPKTSRPTPKTSDKSSSDTKKSTKTSKTKKSRTNPPPA